MVLVLLFFCYQLAQLLALPGILVYLLIRRINRGPIGHLSQRLGMVPHATGTQKPIWLHAASVGETLATEQILRDLTQRFGTDCTYLTAGTMSGFKVGAPLHRTNHSMLPFDFLPTMLLAFWRIKPAALVLVEAELWPNLLLLAIARRLPIFLINARLKPKTGLSGLVYRLSIVPLLKRFHTIWCQNQEERAHFIALGIDPTRVAVMGQIKSYNVLTKQARIPWGPLTPEALAATPPTILAGSLHPGELDTLLAAFKEVRTQLPTARLIIAPRHLTWVERLQASALTADLRVAVWTEHKGPSLQDVHTALEQSFADHEIVVVNTTGMLFNLYPFAPVFILGGTFVPVGGHNILEPCVWHAATIVGPWHQNSAVAINELQQCGGILIAADQQQLAQQLTHLLSNQQARTMQQEAAYTWLAHDASGAQQALQSWYQHLADALL